MSASPAPAQPALSDELFGRFRDLILAKTGISMREGKQILVANRLRRRLAQLGLQSYEGYYQLLTSGREADSEIPHFIDAVSTNETYFFREEAHFDLLAARLLPPLLAAGKPVRIWSAGCATGEEAYTLRIVADAACFPGSPPVDVVGTDISTGVIARARQGVYRERSLKLVPPHVLSRCFLPLGDGSFAVREEIRSRVQFRVHNLFTDPPPGERIQLIFCRNVMIYFDKQTQARLVDTILAPALDPDGFLCIGHAESLAGTSRLLQYASEFRAPVYRMKGRARR